MKTRYLTLLFVTAAGASFALGACSTEPTPLDPEVEARLRNNLPAACTAAQIQACPAVEVTRCPAGQEPVIDFTADCCTKFTCQPICSSPQRGSCPRTPAPACPAGTRLWIGTAIEDCCPAYRCEPDPSMCDPARGDRCGCDATNVACTLALPYCGGVPPIVVGQTADCCPIYQCPCAQPGDGTPPPTTADARLCGCTTPNCQAGEALVCDKTDACGGPCRCEPARGVCKDDGNCNSDQRCDLSACRLPPRPADATAAVCDPTKCGPKPDIASRVCADGTIAGVTDRCLLAADGATCRWEFRDCPTDCFGICVPRAPQTGCSSDADCRDDGQVCNVRCTEWACVPGGTGTGTPTTTDPATGTAPPGAACACDATDTSCVCDASGACKGRKCVGQCGPKPTPTCDPTRPVACPAIAVVCPPDANGNTVQPIVDGVDATCCPKYVCPAPPPVCDPRAATTSTGAGTICAAPVCRCGVAKVIATDPVSCCPKYECVTDATRSCT